MAHSGNESQTPGRVQNDVDKLLIPLCGLHRQCKKNLRPRTLKSISCILAVDSRKPSAAWTSRAGTAGRSSEPLAHLTERDGIRRESRREKETATSSSAGWPSERCRRKIALRVSQDSDVNGWKMKAANKRGNHSALYTEHSDFHWDPHYSDKDGGTKAAIKQNQNRKNSKAKSHPLPTGKIDGQMPRRVNTMRSCNRSFCCWEDTAVRVSCIPSSVSCVYRSRKIRFFSKIQNSFHMNDFLALKYLGGTRKMKRRMDFLMSCSERPRFG
ncbi:unnamed protein product [Nesidiocoris tenuis]|uniref:Uncharacterized protein n=1 Tax=Nesidiocoris tenuis TaxID=355587 RepID=A0A6H5HJH5_9HEMI|nr:unnamed protein product [Nesidiocoris tenuis]